MSTLRTMEADSSRDADSASAATPQQQTPTPQPAAEHLPAGDEPHSPSEPSQRHDEQQQPGRPPPAAETTPAPSQQAAQAPRRRVPSWLERNGIAAAVITSFAALLVYGFMSLSNQIDSLGGRIDRVEDNLNQRITTEIAAVRDDMNQWIDRVETRFAQIDQRFIQIEGRLDQIDQRFADINTILFDHTGRLSRIETTLELGSDAAPQT